MMMKIGQMVMLVGSDGYMPPFGAIGEIVAWDGEDYDVLFPKYPCPHPPGITWCAAPSWLMPINPGHNNILTNAENIAPSTKDENSVNT